MKHLRKYIRNILLESSMKPVAGLKSEGLAIWHLLSSRIRQNRHYILLYSIEDLINNATYVTSRIIEQFGEENLDFYLEKEFKNLMIDSSIAAIIINPPNWPCNGAHVVEVAAGWKGYGPTIYDLAMSISPNGLIADRREVSKKAQSVWKHYFENQRPEIEIKMLDSHDQQWTPEKEDDCLPSINSKSGYGMYARAVPRQRWELDPMNYSYNTDYALGSFKELVNIHNERIKELPQLEKYFSKESYHREVIWDFFEYVKTKRRDL